MVSPLANFLTMVLLCDPMKNVAEGTHGVAASFSHEYSTDT